MKGLVLLAMLASPVTSVTLATPAMAEPWSCSFTARCQSGQPCLADDWPVLITAPYNSSQAVMRADGGQEVALTRLNGDRYHYATSAMLLTITDAGTATLSRHDRPVRSYLGLCEDLR